MMLAATVILSVETVWTDNGSRRSGTPQFRMASCGASVSSSVDKAQQFGPQRVHAASDLEHARKMVMAG